VPVLTPSVSCFAGTSWRTLAERPSWRPWTTPPPWVCLVLYAKASTAPGMSGVNPGIVPPKGSHGPAAPGHAPIEAQAD